MPKPFKHDPHWAKAKQVCRLNMEDIQMAKELGLSPKALMKNQPSSSQRWKLPVKLWIGELHAKRFGSQSKTANRPAHHICPGGTTLMWIFLSEPTARRHWSRQLDCIHSLG